MPIKPAAGYITKSVRSFCSDLAEVYNDNPLFVRAVKLASHSCNDLDNLRDPSSYQPKKVRATGAERKTKAQKVRQALFVWFVDVRETLKGRLPRCLFKLKVNQLDDEWLEQNSVPENERLTFSNCWIQGWDNEYGITLTKPNKRYSIKKKDLIKRLHDYFKNIWHLRQFFTEKYGIDLPIINGDQIPLYRNESFQQKILSFKGEDIFIKENYMLFRERVTVFTQISRNKNIKLNPEFIFKGKGIQTKLAALDSVKYHWSVSGFCRLDQMLKTISNLPNRYNPRTPKGFPIYVLDDYAVHLMPEIRNTLYQRGYVLVVMRGGIT